MPAPVNDPGKIPGKTFIPNCLALRLMWTLPNGKTANNVLHTVFDQTPALTQTIVNDVKAGVLSAFASSGLAPYLHADTSLDGIGIRDMSEIPPAGSNQGHAEFISVGTPSSGTSTDPKPLPSNVSFVVSLKAPISGQQGRGRVYIPGWASNANDLNGHCVDLAAAAAVAFISAIQTFLSGSTYGWPIGIGHPHRQAYTSARTGTSYPDRPAGVATVVNISNRDLVWDTIRLRNRI